MLTIYFHCPLLFLAFLGYIKVSTVSQRARSDVSNPRRVFKCSGPAMIQGLLKSLLKNSLFAKSLCLYKSLMMSFVGYSSSSSSSHRVSLALLQGVTEFAANSKLVTRKSNQINSNQVLVAVA